MFGLKTIGANAGGVVQEVFAKKPTKFMTNSARVAEELTKRCRGLHAHQRLMGGKRAEAAAKYPPELCGAICRGLMQEKKERRLGIRSLCVIGERQEKWTGKCQTSTVSLMWGK